MSEDKLNIAVLGDFEMVVGFQMAGIKDCIETCEKNLERNLERIKDRGIIIISERLYRKIDADKFKNIFVPIPDKYGFADTDVVKDLIKEIIGRGI